MSQNSFDLGVEEAMANMAKIAAGNPAQPQKSSKGGMERSDGPGTAYLNQGGGKAGKHVAGDVESKPQPHPGHVNIGDKKAGTQTGGDVEGRGGSPDTGEKGSAGGDNMTLSKNAGFEAGIDSMIDAYTDDDGDT